MGCCSVTQRHSGTDEVGPDEIELLQVDNTGLWSLGETRLQLSLRNESEEPARRCPPVRELTEESHSPDPVPPEIKHCDHPQAVLWGRSREELHQRIYTEPIRSWEGQAAHAYGEIVWSSRVCLRNPFMQESSERYLVLFSFHLLILALDDLKHEFIYEGVLPLSGMSVRVMSHDSSASNMFEISGPMVDPKVVVCASPADMRKWVESIEARRHKASKQQLSPSNSALSYLVPCDEGWKREELKRYLLRAPIWQWEGTPIQHMGPIGHLSFVRITYSQRQGSQERLLVLFPQDLLFLSVDSQRTCVKYETLPGLKARLITEAGISEGHGAGSRGLVPAHAVRDSQSHGRLPCNSIKALERSALPGRLEFELTGDLVDPLLVSCSCPGDYENWIFRLQQPEKTASPTSTQPAPPLMPKKSQKRANAPQIPM